MTKRVDREYSEFVANYPELSWIFSWVSRVPAERLTEILAEEVSVVSYTSVNFDFEKISIGFYDIEGVLQGTLVNSYIRAVLGCQYLRLHLRKYGRVS
jgi:hypothetical protein